MRTASRFYRLAVLGFLPVLALVLGQECPCSWRNDNRSWTCKPGQPMAVPTQCWDIHEDVRIIEFGGNIPVVTRHDLDHENLLNAQILKLNYVSFVEYDALRRLTQLTYLDIMYGNITQVPDLSHQTLVTSLDFSYNQLTEGPSLPFQVHLRYVGLHHNIIERLPDDFLPASDGSIGMPLVHNNLTELNATSILRAPANSSFTFDVDLLKVVWATAEERDTLAARTYFCNVDLLSIVQLIDDPVTPEAS
ncbi:uncharacterized protein LOC135113718 isoform X1 [Scylla paramamosain]|uniref:uncharacterized protein LOC135113718 isoform X1 n=2 Tax=Scylla paramamosain TaxID=85552 RepID=UPI0030833CD0